jgi:hypothetical protein
MIGEEKKGINGWIAEGNKAKHPIRARMVLSRAIIQVFLVKKICFVIIPSLQGIENYIILRINNSL